MNLFETRKQYHLSQASASKLLNVPLRTYIRYEVDDSYGDKYKRERMIDTLTKECEITETKGLLTINEIKEKLSIVFFEYKDMINFCYLFGSYAKGYANEKSDIDLCVDTELQGLDFVGLSEDIRNALHKKIDLIRLNNIAGNNALISEIMKDGIKVYG